jgi:hypothetical protein
MKVYFWFKKPGVNTARTLYKSTTERICKGLYKEKEMAM